MELKFKISLVILITVLVALVLLFAVDNFYHPKPVQKLSNSELVNCLNEKGFVLYGYGGNVFVDAQLGIFGDEAGNLTFIDCSIEMQKCLGIVVYPSWKTNEGIIPGGLSLGMLARISECDLQ